MSKAVATRMNILQKAFDLIYRNGYQATSIDNIVATTQVTKGAFFHHFKNKEEMGLAMIKEMMYPGMHSVLVKPLIESKEPVVDEIYEMMKNVLLKEPFFQVRYGCPAVNLIEEMSPLNPSFNKTLAQLTTAWREAIETSINQGKALGKIKKEADAGQVAYFIMAGYSGIRNMGKIYGTDCYQTYLQELKNYLKSLT